MDIEENRGGHVLLLLVDAACKRCPVYHPSTSRLTTFLLARGGGGVTDRNGGGAFLIHWVVVGLGDVVLDDGLPF